jgi:hypothetical protein
MSACNNVYQDPESKQQNNKNIETLKYKISANQNIKLGQKVILHFTLTNNSDQNISFLKWGTPFESSISRNILSIKLNGNILPYQGRMVKRGKPTTNDFITIKAKSSLKQQIDISKAYAFKAVGTYSITYNDSLLTLKTPLNKQPLLEIPSSKQIQTLITH